MGDPFFLKECTTCQGILQALPDGSVVSLCFHYDTQKMNVDSFMLLLVDQFKMLSVSGRDGQVANRNANSSDNNFVYVERGCCLALLISLCHYQRSFLVPNDLLCRAP